MRVVLALAMLVAVATAQNIFVDPDYVSSVDETIEDPFVGPDTTDVKDVTEDLDDYEKPQEEVKQPFDIGFVSFTFSLKIVIFVVVLVVAEAVVVIISVII